MEVGLMNTKEIWKRRGNGSTYEVERDSKGVIVKVMNLTPRKFGQSSGPIQEPMEIPLNSDTVRRHMVKRNFKEFTRVK